MGKLHGELHETIRRHYRRAVTFRALNIVLANIDYGIVARSNKARPILHRAEVV
jgi:hypothetical protein